MGFSGGFEKHAFVAPLAGALARGVAAVARPAGRIAMRGAA